jgi:hypothetical protein
MDHQMLDLAVRAAEAMREAAVKAANGGVDSLRRQNCHRDASEREFVARQIGRLDADAIVRHLLDQTAGPDEQAAFEAAATTAWFNVQRRDNGEYFHPITVRAFAIWNAAVRWARREGSK